MKILTGAIASLMLVSATAYMPTHKALAQDVVAVSATNPVRTTADPQNPVDIPNLSTSFTVPAGKTADIVIMFSGSVTPGLATFVRPLIDGAEIQPNGLTQINFSSTITGGSSHGFNFYKKNVGPGNHLVRMQWAGANGEQLMTSRSMIVLVNVK